MTEINDTSLDCLYELTRKVVRIKTMFCLMSRRCYVNLVTDKRATNFLRKLISMPVQQRPSGSG